MAHFESIIQSSNMLMVDDTFFTNYDDIRHNMPGTSTSSSDELNSGFFSQYVFKTIFYFKI